MKFPGSWVSGFGASVRVEPTVFDETDLSERSDWKEALQNEDADAPHGFVDEQAVEREVNRRRFAFEELGPDWACDACAMPDGRLASWDHDASIRIWTAARREPRLLTGHKRDVRGVSLLANGDLLSWSYDRTLRIWPAGGGRVRVLKGHTDEVCGALERPDGSILSWSLDGALRLWRSDGKPFAVLEGHEGGVCGALLQADGRIISWGRGEGLRQWSQDGAYLRTLPIDDIWDIGALLLPDDRILSWSPGSGAQIWSRDGELQQTLSGSRSARITGARRLDDGGILTWGSRGTLRIWGADGSLRLLKGQRGRVVDVLPLPSGRLLSWGDTLWLWEGDLRSGKPLRGHRSVGVEAGLRGAGGLASGRIVSWGGDRTLRLWTADGTPLGVLSRDMGHWNEATATVLPDGRLLSWGGDGGLRLWTV